MSMNKEERDEFAQVVLETPGILKKQIKRLKQGSAATCVTTVLGVIAIAADIKLGIDFIPDRPFFAVVEYALALFVGYSLVHLWAVMFRHIDDTMELARMSGQGDIMKYFLGKMEVETIESTQEEKE